MKIICVGRNYSSHIKELANEKPIAPVLFLKPDTSILQKNHPFYIPHFSSNIDYEVEVLIRINKIGKHIQSKFSHKYYEEISLGVDFTARIVQNQLKSNGLPWEKSKSFDGSALIGEWFKKNEFENIDALSFNLKVNNHVVQHGNTSEMLWKIDELIAEISQFFTLKIGDIIFTGTPAGIGSISDNDLLEGFLMGEKVFSVKVK